MVVCGGFVIDFVICVDVVVCSVWSVWDVGFGMLGIFFFLIFGMYGNVEYLVYFVFGCGSNLIEWLDSIN